MLAEYPWLGELPGELPELQGLEARFPPAHGLQRVPVARGSFAAWLRRLPVRTDRTQPLSWKGVLQQRPSAAVVALDVGGLDLQQCADTLIRLHAEYLWAAGLEETTAYHFTSGHFPGGAEPRARLEVSKYWTLRWVPSPLARISHALLSRGRGDAYQCGLSTKTLLRRAQGTLQATLPGERLQ